MEYVIFSIDQQEDQTAVNDFLLEFASAGLEGNCIPLRGCWKGMQETSFICRRGDFEWVKKAGYVKRQECVLVIQRGYCSKFYAFLEGMETGGTKLLGQLVQVSKDEAMKHDGWTYREDTDAYFIVRDFT